jgi:hypothetical protein
MPSIRTLLGGYGGRQSDHSSPESSPGGPTYDARVDHTITAGEIVGSERLQAQRNLHLFDSKSAPAEAFSHAYDSQPSGIAVQIMGLAGARDQIERVVSRKALPPFPGVELGHVPAFANAPHTNPIVQPFDHFAHGAHLGSSRNIIEQGRTGRRRFGHV